MTMEELAKNIVIYFNDEDHDFTEENINNFLSMLPAMRSICISMNY